MNYKGCLKINYNYIPLDADYNQVMVSYTV